MVCGEVETSERGVMKGLRDQGTRGYKRYKAMMTMNLKIVAGKRFGIVNN